MRLQPVIMLLSDHMLSRCQWTLQRETERLAGEIAASEELWKMMAENGWTARMLAWAHILNGLMDLADFDDEKGHVRDYPTEGAVGMGTDARENATKETR